MFVAAFLINGKIRTDYNSDTNRTVDFTADPTRLKESHFIIQHFQSILIFLV